MRATRTAASRTCRRRPSILSGGYEPSYGHKTYGLPAQVAPETERLLIETGVRLVRSLFPERQAPAVDGWLATGALPPRFPSRHRAPLAVVAETAEPNAGRHGTRGDRAAARPADARLRPAAGGRDGLRVAARGDGAGAGRRGARRCCVGVDTLGIRRARGRPSSARASPRPRARRRRERPAQLEPHPQRAAGLPLAARAERPARRPRATSGSMRYWELLRERVIDVAATAAAASSSRRAVGGAPARSTSRSTGASAAPTARIVHGWRVDGLLDRQVVSLQAAAPRRERDRDARRLRLPHRVGRAWTSPATRPTSRARCARACPRSGRAASASSSRAPRATCCRGSSFVEDEREAERMGERLAVESHALAQRPARPGRGGSCSAPTAR